MERARGQPHKPPSAYQTGFVMLDFFASELTEGWLTERETIAMLKGILEETPLCQNFLAEGKQQGIVKGIVEGKRQCIVEGKRQGVVDGLRDAVLIAIERLHASLLPEARQRVESLVLVAALEGLLQAVLVACSADGAGAALMGR